MIDMISTSQDENYFNVNQIQMKIIKVMNKPINYFKSSKIKISVLDSLSHYRNSYFGSAAEIGSCQNGK